MKKRIFFITIILSIMSLFLSSCNLIKLNSNTSLDYISGKGDINVHYIDVGQGDSILIQVNNKNLLIDAGPKSGKNDLLNYLSKLKIEKLDYVIATHPHEDHIGNMADIIKKYEIGAFYAPKVETNTKTFEKMVDALKDKDLKINSIKAGVDSIDLGASTKVSIYSPNTDKYENLNNYSPIIKIQFGSNSFLFTGDAEKEVEKEVLKTNADLKADVLKLGHHGSSSSTSEEFLRAVSPSLGIICVGIDNSYGHPTKQTLKLLEDNKIKIFRTDKDGSIIISSDGTSIRIES
ncbi:ComEC/Rec2 family competence protein [Clostridium vincentii]|uniref:ComEC family competence protein n=1 Tax=Clostridium vincentii TaxID=52704 RepID=A0A2T0BBQ0_9CLOT|nr:ComEC/Rec2 family competence protein [Clostridium vincentii]PRR81314.1 ComEC family competence protein [Clostridium vincentii]